MDNRDIYRTGAAALSLTLALGALAVPAFAEGDPVVKEKRVIVINEAMARRYGLAKDALDAYLEPQLSGDLDFQLAESAAFGRPLTGRGTASLSP